MDFESLKNKIKNLKLFDRIEIKDKKEKVLILAIIAFIALACVCVHLESLESNEVINVNVSELPEAANVDIYNSLIINEVVANNDGVYVNEFNESCDFIELYNGSAEEINMLGWGLSDRDDKIKWSFPSVVIGPGEYLVVNLTGKTQTGLNASFKLSSKGGEQLVLINKSGEVVDGVDTKALGKNQAMVRDNAQWDIVNYATPGFENSLTGLQLYEESLFSTEECPLVINEFLCDNKGNFKNSLGRYDGYIELKNISSKKINLSEYTLSNEKGVPFKFTLPEIYLEAGGIYCVFTGSVSQVYEDYTGFSLTNKNGDIILSKNGKILVDFKYENVPNGCAYVRGDNGLYYESADLSMGLENNAAGIEAFEKQYMQMPEGLIINELMSSNNSYLAQNGYSFYDWIELYNNSSESINLSDYYLSNDESKLTLYRLPAISLDPNQYIVIMCSGDQALTNDNYYHANFKLGSSESIYLSNADGIKDSVFIYDLPIDCSYCRNNKYGWVYTYDASPCKQNEKGFFTKSPSPEIISPAGIYDESSIKVELSGQGTIYYTLDGSNPTKKSKIYKEAITLTEPTVVKAVAVVNNGLLSDVVISSFIVNDPHDVPVVSISLDPDEYNYLYKHAFNYDLRYTAYFELFEEDGSCQSFCGIALNGYTGRRYNKKNYSLKFDGEFGATDLNYKVFDELDCSRFDSLVLRGGSNAEESLPWKDEFGSALASDYLVTRLYKTCILYINGEYKGLFNIREKINSEMIADRYNVDKALLNMEKWNGTVEYGQAVWTEIREWGESHDLSIKENYDYFCSKVDVTSLCDLWIYEMFMDNPDITNIRIFSHPDIDGGRCKFIFFDVDLGFYGIYDNYLTGVIFNSSGYTHDLAGHNVNIKINNSLLKNDEFKKLFQERLNYHLENSLNTENTVKLFDKFTDLYASEIERTMAAHGYTTKWYNTSIKSFRRELTTRTNLLKTQAAEFFK